MLLIHDIVEIDAGDTFLYDDKGNLDKLARETDAANRIFGMLQKSMAKHFIDLWKEFENSSTIKAIFAASLDGMQPIVNHLVTNGIGIKKYNLMMQQVIEKKNT